MKLRERGQSLIEFTFVGIPLIFILISTFEISRGMWIYISLDHAVKEGVRYAIVHGENCAMNGNTCQVNLGPAQNKCNNTNPTVAEVIMCAGIGLDPTLTKVTFTSSVSVIGPVSLNAIPAGIWPPANGNQPGLPITISITTPFNSAISLLWPGGKPVSFSAVTLGASSSDQIQF